ncbi:MAG: extracellular solute-binding protein [Eubacteriales bacterium]|nr:extracellular solute-binding protein [Eubacteriales bacterium]
MKKRIVFSMIVVCLLAGCAQSDADRTAATDAADPDMVRETELSDEQAKEWETAATTPYGKYPLLVTYTLGKMNGENNSNMPAGDTYEDNVYTRYLRETLNIQNEDIFEENEEQYTTNVKMAIASEELPDVMIVEDKETLQQLVEEDLIADLTDAYENCASEGIRAMYDSYENSAVDTAIFDGKLMALPEPSFVDGPNLLWLRKDWLDQLGMKEPETIADVEEIVRAFIREDPGGNGEGSTVGLVCHSDLTGESGYNYEFQLDPIFSFFEAYPKQWMLDEEGNVVYGSIQPQAKEALAHINELYEEGVLDQSFMLRSMSNIAELIIDGKCGSFFGPWWAPNNPLMDAKAADPDAVWEPYLIATTQDGKTRYFDQRPSYKYVVVRKDFEHPEIVFKMASVMFDKMRYEDNENSELETYFQLNVDSTARPIAINIDYSNALYQCYEQVNAALNGEIDPDDLQILEHSYYVLCEDYQAHPEEAQKEEWAAYVSRIKACALLQEEHLEVISPVFSGETESMASGWWKLQELEKKAYLELITGEKDMSYFETFVEEWKEQGGEQILKEVQQQIEEE